MTPTARSLDHCRRMGWPAGVVERWNPHSRTRHDLFGWCDLIVLATPLSPLPDARGNWIGQWIAPGIIGVQICAGASHAARMAKCRPLVGPWLATGGAAEVWSWSKAGPRGHRKTWTLRREAIVPPEVLGRPQDEPSPADPWPDIRALGRASKGRRRSVAAKS